MTKVKMNFDGISNLLTREEMKEIMAGTTRAALIPVKIFMTPDGGTYGYYADELRGDCLYLFRENNDQCN